MGVKSVFSEYSTSKKMNQTMDAHRNNEIRQVKTQNHGMETSPWKPTDETYQLTLVV